MSKKERLERGCPTTDAAWTRLQPSRDRTRATQNTARLWWCISEKHYCVKHGITRGDSQCSVPVGPTDLDVCEGDAVWRNPCDWDKLKYVYFGKWLMASSHCLKISVAELFHINTQTPLNLFEAERVRRIGAQCIDHRWVKICTFNMSQWINFDTAVLSASGHTSALLLVSPAWHERLFVSGSQRMNLSCWRGGGVPFVSTLAPSGFLIALRPLNQVSRL